MSAVISSLGGGNGAEASSIISLWSLCAFFLLLLLREVAVLTVQVARGSTYLILILGLLLGKRLGGLFSQGTSKENSLEENMSWESSTPIAQNPVLE